MKCLLTYFHVYSSLRSFTKSHDVSSRRVSFGPVHEYHRDDDYEPLDEMVYLVSSFFLMFCPPHNLYVYISLHGRHQRLNLWYITVIPQLAYMVCLP